MLTFLPLWLFFLLLWYVEIIFYHIDLNMDIEFNETTLSFVLGNVVVPFY